MNHKCTLVALPIALLACGILVCASEGQKTVAPCEVAFGEANGSLRCGIILPKLVYRVGDTVTATVLLQNEGTRPMRVVRYNEQKNGHRAHFEWNAPKPNRPSPFVCACEVDAYCGELAETLVINPGEVYGFKMSDKITDRHQQFPFVSVAYFLGRYGAGFPRKAPAWVAEVAKESPLWHGYATSGKVEIHVTR